jgi:uncharacterized protein with PQ loop repeat
MLKKNDILMRRKVFTIGYRNNLDKMLESIASFVFSILSIIFYSVVYYPQFYLIYKTKNTDGISIWMLLVWGQADFLSLIGVVTLNLDLSLVLIGWYHAFIGFLMTLYTLYYEKNNKVKKYIAVGLYYCINIGISMYLTISFLYSYEAGTVLGWISSILYIIGRFPQVYLNYRRKNTEGLSMLMYVFTILGNIFYLLSVLAFSLEPEYIYINMPWIFMIVITVIMDFIVLYQFKYYKARQPTSIRVVNVSESV